MGCKRTYCIEKPLADLFEKLGWLVGSYPVWFFIIPLIVSASLGGGFYFLNDRLDNDIERQLTPKNGPSKIIRDLVKDIFPQDDPTFSSQRLYSKGSFASIIALANDGSNVLTKHAFEDIIKLNSKVNRLSVNVDQRELSYCNVCAKSNGDCVTNDILEMINYNASRIEQINITFPLYQNKSKPVFLGCAIGGVEENGTGVIKRARAIRLMYYLEKHEMAEVWLDKFQRVLSNERENKHIKVSYYTSQSLQQEIEKNTTDGIPLFSITYALAITFSVISCLRLDNVRNKVWVSAVGILSAGLAVLSSFGLMLYIGKPFAITVANSPFLILGIGVDDMFIMVSNWQQTKVKDPVAERMAHTYKEAAMSITITTLTDVLGFCIGLMSDFPCVQSFCLYTSTAILFCYIYNITFFGAFLALNGRREACNRHWLTCMKVPLVHPDECSCGYSICCVGGDYDQDTGTEKEQPISGFFKRYYGPLLIKPWTKAVVILIYAGYLAVSIYGCLNIQQGTEFRDLAADDSYVIKFFDNDRQHFSNYGPNVMIIVTEEFQYWDQKKRSDFHSCIDNFKNLHFVNKDMYTSWLDSYQYYGQMRNLNINDGDIFIANLPSFFNVSPYFKQDVNVTNSVIHASRFFIQTVHIANASMEIEMFTSLKETAERCAVVPLMVYHPSFIFYDQYDVIVSSTVLNIGINTAVMLLVSLLLSPNPLCSLWVSFSIGSVIMGVTGFMAFWDVNLDCISMIILVVCVGFTVDFSAHISYSFVSSNKESPNESVIDALFTLGYPIMQGAMSTIFGVVVLASSKNHIFRILFKIIFLVMVFGLVHGITFIPVFLTLCCQNKSKSEMKQDSPHWALQYNNKQNENKLDKKYSSYGNRGFTSDTGNV